MARGTAMPTNLKNELIQEGEIFQMRYFKTGKYSKG